jgi:hypothetical protein
MWSTDHFLREDAPDVLTALSEPSYRARPERVIVFTIEAWDTNCPSHITPLHPS